MTCTGHGAPLDQLQLCNPKDVARGEVTLELGYEGRSISDRVWRHVALLREVDITITWCSTPGLGSWERWLDIWGLRPRAVVMSNVVM